MAAPNWELEMTSNPPAFTPYMLAAEPPAPTLARAQVGGHALLNNVGRGHDCSLIEAIDVGN